MINYQIKLNELQCFNVVSLVGASLDWRLVECQEQIRGPNYFQLVGNQYQFSETNTSSRHLS